MSSIAFTPHAAILFDLDGTLLHTAPDLSVAVNQLRGDYGLSPLPTETAIAMVGRGAFNLILQALAPYIEAHDDFDLEVAYTKFAAHYHRINGRDTVEYAGVTETLRALKAAGKRLGIVTNKPTEFSLPLVRQFGWTELFDVVVCGDTLAVKKPDPQPILHACAELGVAVDDALMVGDSMNDAHGAVNAACDCVLLDYGYNEGTPIRDAVRDACLEIAVYSDFAQALAQA